MSIDEAVFERLWRIRLMMCIRKGTSQTQRVEYFEASATLEWREKPCTVHFRR